MSTEVNAAQAEPEAPVETVVEDNATEATAASPDVSGDQPKVIEVDEKQKALNKLAFEKREQKRRADALQIELDKINANPAPVATKAPVMPKEADFDFDTDAYQSAVAKYNSEMVNIQVDERLSAQREQEKQVQANRSRQEVQTKFNKQVVESSIEGYAEAIGTLPNFDPFVLDAIMQSDNGVKIAYYLSQHLDQADVIAMSNHVQAAMKIGAISSQLANATKQTKTSAAPDPIEPINQGGAVVSDGVDPLIKGATFE